jgi:predicted MPP superfamily phosphohydrolase
MTFSYRQQLSETLADTDVDRAEVELNRRPSGQEEFKISLHTYGFRLCDEAGVVAIGSNHQYSVKTEAETFAQALPEHARRVAEARRRIQFDFRKQLQANVKSEMQEDPS